MIVEKGTMFTFAGLVYELKKDVDFDEYRELLNLGVDQFIGEFLGLRLFDLVQTPSEVQGDIYYLENFPGLLAAADQFIEQFPMLASHLQLDEMAFLVTHLDVEIVVNFEVENESGPTPLKDVLAQLELIINEETNPEVMTSFMLEIEPAVLSAQLHASVDRNIAEHGFHVQLHNPTEDQPWYTCYSVGAGNGREFIAVGNLDYNVLLAVVNDFVEAWKDGRLEERGDILISEEGTAATIKYRTVNDSATLLQQMVNRDENAEVIQLLIPDDKGLYPCDSEFKEGFNQPLL